MATDISLEPTTVNLTVYKGDSINLKINLIESGATYTIPSGGTWLGKIKKTSDATFPATFTVTTETPATAFKVYLAGGSGSTGTSGLIPGDAYTYDIQYTWIESSITYIRTFIKGSITVLDEVTLNA